MPSYNHIFLIILENRSTDEIIAGTSAAPTLNRLAKDYGIATNFYATRHPSEPNYVAMVGGDTFGIADDDAFFCKPGSTEWGCTKASSPTYVDHTVSAPNLAQQLDQRGISWKGYFEDIPEPASRVYRWPSQDRPAPGKPDALYAVKHNGFMTFKSVQDDPKRTEKVVGFDALDRDFAAGTLPRFAYIVPNQCNDMHGLHGHDVPDDCTGNKTSDGLIGRADRTVAKIVARIMDSAAWKEPGNDAIVITFDENDDKRDDGHPLGCCGNGGTSPGGGWIATIVIANHGPRHAIDPTPYNHYSLLRTIEAAYGITDYLGHAADTDKGVVTMTPLFAAAAH